MPLRVLFVSKPIVPPFHDGTKCLVRDVALHLERAEAVVMSAPGAPALESVVDAGLYPRRDGRAPVQMAPVYPDAGRFAPALLDNVRAAAFLLARSRADVWHYVFAPNPRSSAVGSAIGRLRRAPVLQTVASAPRRFEGLSRLLFGQIVVAQSEWTRRRIVDAYEREGVAPAARPRLEVVPPPVGPLRPRSADTLGSARRALGIPEAAPLFVYPGDLETSSGAEDVAAVVAPIVRELPDAVIVFAYREKTPEAPRLARALEQRLDSPNVRFESELPDVLALIGSASAVLFPVDDLWGKVDLPIVLLESMSLGVPVVAIDHGPLSELDGTVRVPRGDREALAGAALELVRDAGRRTAVVDAQRAAVERRFRAGAVAAAYERLYEDLAPDRSRAPRARP
jgi:phosphatidylinositol alpha-1,6-mannosyltransferase